MAMPFNLWLFAVKHLGQTFDASKLIYDQLSNEQKEALLKEYEEYSKKNC